MKKIVWMSLALLAALTTVVVAGTPFRETLTVTGGSGVYTIPADGVKVPYGEAVKFLAVITPSAVGTTNTIKVVDGTTTNTIATKVVAENDSDTALSADWWHFEGELLIIECSATNAFEAILVGEEV